jgi:DNA polymerase III epsilon subunit family exonuclease
MLGTDACSRDRTIVAIDLETTGLHSAVDRIIEIAAVRFVHEGEVVDRFEALINPGCAIPESAIRVHGIREDDLRDAARVEEVLPRFVAWLGPSTDSGYLIAHHAAFDCAFLGEEGSRAGLDLTGYEVIDTLTLARWKWPHAPSHRLEQLMDWLGLPGQVTHRAMADAEALRFLWNALGVDPESSIERYRMESQSDRVVAMPSRLAGLQDRVARGESIRIVYEGGSHGRAPRHVTPIGLCIWGGTGYLIAECHLDGVRKRFHLDRIRSYDVVSDLPQAGSAGSLGT